MSGAVTWSGLCWTGWLWLLGRKTRLVKWLLHWPNPKMMIVWARVETKEVMGSVLSQACCKCRSQRVFWWGRWRRAKDACKIWVWVTRPCGLPPRPYYWWLYRSPSHYQTITLVFRRNTCVTLWAISNGTQLINEQELCLVFLIPSVGHCGITFCSKNCDRYWCHPSSSSALKSVEKE